ncbi:interleukin-36 gamma isoform X2 [Camelus dromedarius]|uniref:Interleukin-1 n=2 Tax=Camelus TaxID=9836 RepID=A0A8B7K9H6_CAMFR|nr:interleukin-36 gamma [Camelus bactrianus]XP_010983966.1 interleukin-36 gamma [Camelus dromedarius]XP_014413783.1 interleukin-36 gamma [Camelus ferus]
MKPRRAGYQDNPLRVGNWKGSTHGGHHTAAVDKPQTVDISDLSQQMWVLQGQSLVTVPRNNRVASVTATIVPCKYPEALEQGKGTPIYVGIENPEMCLCCEDIGGQPTLQLKEQKIMDLYNQAKPVKPYLFYHTRMGRTSTFESVAFPGWFIASSEKGQPIILTSDLGTTHNTAFNLDFKTQTQPRGGN